jgi:diamine N-acetyltransferase
MTDEIYFTSESITLVPVDPGNWRDVAKIRVAKDQLEFVADPLYYLALCNYGQTWHPLAILADGKVIGMLMWAEDPSDHSCWLGGICLTRKYQGYGFGRVAVTAAIDLLSKQGFKDFALSYKPENSIARNLYLSMGFVETGEKEDEESVARLHIQ